MNSNNNTMEIQQQVRNNASELNDFLKGMKTWQQEMQAKDDQLLEAARMRKEKELDKAPSSRKLISPPPMRTSRKTDESYKTKNKSKDGFSDESQKQMKSEKIKAYDYSAWDKFDVDKACDEVDVNAKDREESSGMSSKEYPADAKSSKAIKNEYVTTNQKSPLIMKQQAVAEKERGNNFLKKEKYSEAIECYTKGIHCDPSNAVLPANRAMALLKTRQFSEAELDCTLSLSIDPTYVKAYQRRATARSHLKRYEDAAKDYNVVLDLEPNNKVAKIELEKLKSKLEDEQNKSSNSNHDNKSSNVKAVETVTSKRSFENNIKSAFGSIKSKELTSKSTNDTKAENTALTQLKPGQILPIEKKPHLRSKKPLKKVPIHEIGTIEEKTLNIKETRDNDFIIRKSSEQGNSEKLSMDKEAKVKSKIKIEEIDSSNSSNSPQISIDQSDSFKEVTMPVSKSVGYVKKVEEDLVKSLQNVKSSNLNVKSKNATPSSSVGFYNTWNSLQNGSDDEKIAYLNVMKPKDYPIIFKHSLEPSVFEQILRLLSRYIIDDKNNIETVATHLYGLTKVPRVSAMVMFLNADDKARLHTLVDEVEKSESTKENRKKAIKKLLQ